jgi:hypothetical protein
MVLMSADLTRELEALTARVAVLEDMEALRRLHHQFHQMINGNRWESVGELFAPDADLDYAHLGTYRGRKSIETFFRRMPVLIEAEESATATVFKQYPHAHDIRIEGDRGRGHSYFEVKAVLDGTSYVLAGKSVETYERLNGHWLFSSMTIHLYWMVPLAEGWAQNDKIKGPLVRRR